MASIIEEITIDTTPAAAWDAVRDWQALHERLVPGFVVSAEVDGDARVITFFDGMVATERIVGLDETARCLAWTVTDGSPGLEHYNASAQVIPEPGGGVRFVWTVDVLPHAAAAIVSARMDCGIQTIKHTLGRSPQADRG